MYKFKKGQHVIIKYNVDNYIYKGTGIVKEPCDGSTYSCVVLIIKPPHNFFFSTGISYYIPEHFIEPNFYDEFIERYL